MLRKNSGFCEHGNALYGFIKYGNFLKSLITKITSMILQPSISKPPSGTEMVKIVKIDLTPKLYLFGDCEIHRPNVFTGNSQCNKTKNA